MSGTSVFKVACLRWSLLGDLFKVVRIRSVLEGPLLSNC